MSDLPCPDNPFQEFPVPKGPRSLGYDLTQNFAAAGTKGGVTKTLPMRIMQNELAQMPNEMVFKLFDRCKWFEDELKREQAKNSQLTLELAQLRAGDEEEGETTKRRTVKKG